MVARESIKSLEYLGNFCTLFVDQSLYIFFCNKETVYICFPICHLSCQGIPLIHCILFTKYKLKCLMSSQINFHAIKISLIMFQVYANSILNSTLLQDLNFYGNHLQLCYTF